MITENISIIKLTASEGYVLTNGEAYGEEIYLGCNDRPENWREINRAEYDEILKQNQEELNEV